MRENVEHRAITLGVYIAQTGATVRRAAEVYSVGKSTVHKDVTERLRSIDPVLYAQVNTILQTNKSERHLRGGEATRKKYAELAEAKK
ncbi:MAG: sporulation transcriptional regulator SpoIIID [Clostridia bacterium]|nr:sporulation transcriptional regulator SpoIIID [Clostridia bacterium]